MIVTPLNFFENGVAPPTPYDYSGAEFIFSLQKLIPSFSSAILEVQRDSDNATAWVFFDGAVSYDTITLNSYISTVNSTTPSTTTLGSWAGVSNVYCLEWYDQQGGLSVDSGTPTASGLLADKPQLISSGSLITKNGTVSLLFSGNDAFYQPTPRTALNSTNDFTIFSVSASNSTTAKYPLFHTGRVTLNAFTLWIDSSATNEMAYAYGTTTSSTANYSTTINTTNQRLLTAIYTPTALSAWYNSTVESETGVAHSGTYTNDEFYIGRGRNAAPLFLNGYYQELIGYASDESADRTSVEDDINTRYSIF